MEEFEKYKDLLKTPGALKYENQKPAIYDQAETDKLIQKFLKGIFYSYDARISKQVEAQDKWELDEIYHREDTLGHLNDIIQTWIQRVAMRQEMNENLAKKETARILTFGSHRLGVNTRNGDIDTVLLVPNYVDRDTDFFGDLGEILRTDPDVKNLVLINDKNVSAPIITMDYRKISVDMGFARLDSAKLDDKLDLLDNRTLTNMDEQMIASLNGCRNVDLIVKSVSADVGGNSETIKNFRTTLKLVKHWAKNKAIYSNSAGYLGGISWAILTAKICQIFPNVKPNKLLRKFFKFYSQWKWNEIPVIITPIVEDRNLEGPNKKQWIDIDKIDPSSSAYANHPVVKMMTMNPPQMMVITPAFPCMNSTSKVRRTNLKVIDYHLKESWNVINKKPVDWDQLFKKFDFFKHFKHFIQVDILGDTDDEFHKWSGWVESQMIHFTTKLEDSINEAIVEIYPYSEGYSVKDPKYSYSTAYFYGMKVKEEFKDQIAKTGLYLDLRPAAVEFIEKIKKKYIIGCNIKIQHLTRCSLPDEVFEGIRPKWAISKNPKPDVEFNEDSQGMQIEDERLRDTGPVKKAKLVDPVEYNMDPTFDEENNDNSVVETSNPYAISEPEHPNGAAYAGPTNGYNNKENNVENGVTHENLLYYQGLQEKQNGKDQKNKASLEQFTAKVQKEVAAPPTITTQLEATNIADEELDDLLN